MSKQAVSHRDCKQAVYGLMHTFQKLDIHLHPNMDPWFSGAAHAVKYGKSDPVYEYPWQGWIERFKEKYGFKRD